MPRRTKRSRSKIPLADKQALCREAGFKCANPGCPNRLGEYHHIVQWSVVGTHDPENMIVLCPTCHAQVRRGDRPIDNETLRRWKRIVRNRPPAGHIYVEPGDGGRVLIGTIYVAADQSANDGIVILHISEKSYLSFKLTGSSAMLLDASIADANETQLVLIESGSLLNCDFDRVSYKYNVGWHSLTVPATADYVPDWLLDRYDETSDHPLAQEGRLTLFDAEVIEPGVVQVLGIWAQGRNAVVITPRCVSVCNERLGGFIHIAGYGAVRGDRDLGNLPIVRGCPIRS